MLLSLSPLNLCTTAHTANQGSTPVKATYPINNLCRWNSQSCTWVPWIPISLRFVHSNLCKIIQIASPHCNSGIPIKSMILVSTAICYSYCHLTDRLKNQNRFKNSTTFFAVRMLFKCIITYMIWMNKNCHRVKNPSTVCKNNCSLVLGCDAETDINDLCLVFKKNIHRKLEVGVL